MTFINQTERTQGIRRLLAARGEWCSSVALQAFIGTVVSLAMAATGWSYGGTAFTSSTVKPAGPRTGTSGTNFLNVEGDGNAANASFGVIDFNSSSFSIGAGVTSISNLILSLTESNAAFTLPGSLNFYLSQDTTTDISSANTALKYNASAAPEGVGTQLTPLTLLGAGSFTTTGNVNSGQVDTYTLTLPSSVQSYFLNQLNSGLTLRLVVTPTNSSTAATFVGGTNSTVSMRPTLSFDATLNQPSLAWKGGAGTWNPAGTTGDTSWSGGPWQSNQTAIFNVAGGGNVALSGAVTAVGMTFDADGYTVSGAAGTSLTLTGGIVQVTNAGQSATVSAVLAGTIGITKNGAGTLILSGANTYTGATTINGGAVTISSDGNLGAASNGVALNNGTLRTAAAVSLGAGRTLSGSGTLDATGGAMTVAGTVNAGALSVKGGSVAFSNAGGAVFSSADVAAGSTLNLVGGVTSTARTVLSGDGSVVLTGDNSGFTAGFSTARGTGATGPAVTLTSATSLGTGTVFFNAGSIQAATDTTLDTTISFGGNAGVGGTAAGTTGALTLNSFALHGTNKKILTVNVSTTLPNALAGDASGVSVGNSLNKAGLGRLILLAVNNSYNGGTSITGGTLEVGAQSLLGTGDVSVTALANAHVTLQIDNPASIDDLSNVVLTSNGSFHGRLDLEFASTSSETINSLAIDGVAVAPGNYTAAQLAMRFQGVILGTGSLTINNLAVIPEPSATATLALVGVLAGGLAARRRMFA